MIKNLLLGWKGYAVAAVGSAIIAGSAAIFITLTIKNLEIERLKNAQLQFDVTAANEAFSTLRDLSIRINDAANLYAGDKAKIDAAFSQITKELKDAFKNPLPADCKPDPARVRVNNAAIEAANRAAAGR